MPNATTRTDPSSQQKAPLWTSRFILLTLSNTLLFFGFQMLLPTLPVFVSEHGGSSTEVGLVIGVLTLAAILIRPFSGMALDSLGRRLILNIGLLITLLAMGGFYAAASVGFVLLLRFVHGIGWGISTTTFGVIASDMIPDHRRGEGMGYFGLGTTLAMALGPFLGLELLKAYGFGPLFLCVFGSTLLSFVCVQFAAGSEPARAAIAGLRQEPAASLGSRLVDRQALFPSLLVLLLGVTYGGIVGFITLFGREAGLASIGWFFLINALSVFLVRPISGKLFDQKGHVWVLLPGALFSIIGLLLLSLTASQGMLIAAAFLYGIGLGAIQPSIQAWIINRTPPSRRGAANATYFSAFDLGIGGGGMLLGIVAEQTSYALMYRYSIFFMLVFVVIYGVYILKGKRS
ncbi:MFS transporter [Paenibacillus sp. y28]|uniref:MFS transporter n=1 Tax=Paenibacillus sp. y28 TaxID=3129110 RepID=UPI00301AE85D